MDTQRATPQENAIACSTTSSETSNEKAETLDRRHRSAPHRELRELVEQRAIRGGGALDQGVVALDELFAHRRQSGAASRLAADPLHHDGAPKRGVQVVDEKPGASIRHVHLAGRGGDRLVLANLA